MKHFILAFLLLPLSLFAQQTHKVGPKETLFSIGRLYNVNPRELASFNNLPAETAVKIGQVLKIPKSSTATETASTVTTPTTTVSVKNETVAEGGVAVYHKVLKGETLYQISIKYPNATVEKIKKWNKLSGDGVNEGAKLIVAWSNNTNTAVTANTTNTASTATTAVVKSTTPTPTPAETNVPTEVKRQNKPDVSTYTAGDGGFFKKSFVKIEGLVAESGTVGVFKSTSGWDDGKYYCLFNKAASGTIVKVVNPSNNKFIYAKVLDVMPDIRQNKDKLITISNAAAEQLGVKQDIFVADISY